MGLAVRYGAIGSNPVRDVDRIEGQASKEPRALTAEEVFQLRRQLSADVKAVRADLPDLVSFLLGTGVRIGEALAVLWSQVDLETRQVEVTHTIVRVKGEGLIRKVTKSRAGERNLVLPKWAMPSLRARLRPAFAWTSRCSLMLTAVSGIHRMYVGICARRGHLSAVPQGVTSVCPCAVFVEEPGCHARRRPACWDGLRTG
jgi:integrase